MQGMLDNQRRFPAALFGSISFRFLLLFCRVPAILYNTKLKGGEHSMIYFSGDIHGSPWGVKALLRKAEAGERRYPYPTG